MSEINVRFRLEYVFSDESTDEEIVEEFAELLHDAANNLTVDDLIIER